jgi:curved DNA-binding protein
MIMTDLYKILGVAPNATADQIKQAYRTLARKLHPDVNSDPDSQEQFKQVNSAYETLSDPDKRAAYDAPASNQFHFHHARSGAHNIHDIFAQMFGQMGGNSPFHNKPTRNQDLMFQLNISLEEAFQGKQVPINFVDAQQRPINVLVNIPPGAEHGMRLRYAGNGDRTHSTLPPGDLIIIIHVEPHATWTRSGAHLHQEIQVPLWQALVGDQIQIKCIDASMISVTVPELTVHGTTLKVPHKGMRLRNNTTRGDLFLHVNVIMPDSLTTTQREQIRSWCKP